MPMVILSRFLADAANDDMSGNDSFKQSPRAAERTDTILVYSPRAAMAEL